MFIIILSGVLILSIAANFMQATNNEELEMTVESLGKEQTRLVQTISDTYIELEKLTTQLEKAKQKRNEYRLARNYAQGRVDDLEIKYAEETGKKGVLCGRKFKK